jgi:threonine aldolase
MLLLVPEPIDLRSDTVTRPTPEMRRAMAAAELGDDVFRDDPTVIALEERAAELTGKEAAVFVASGTMGNLVAHMAHVARGGEILVPQDAHLAMDEAAGHAVVTGASARSVPVRADGTMDLDALRSAFRNPDDEHEPLSALVVLENTHAHTMGQPISAAHMMEVARIAREHGVPLHVDGARLFNAVVALGTSARDLLASADSATFCLSKGLSCPVGSVVVGPSDFIRRARRARKLVGGGMRQVGVLAAPGLIALREGAAGMIERLAEDHETARALAEGLAGIGGVSGLDPTHVRTNFVIFAVPDRGAFLDALAREGVLMVPYSQGRIRAVTHHGIGMPEIGRTLEAVGHVVAEVSPPGRAVAAAT